MTHHRRMKKYGVRTTDTTAKTASTGCPYCGKALTKLAGVVLCPVHGSEPFEHEYGSEEDNDSNSTT